MKTGKRVLSSVLALAMVVGLLPTSVFVPTAAAANDQYRIQNDYMRYTVNPQTGGFSVETLEGHPQKDLDNDLPLLYRDDLEESPNTSYTTLRIDGQDYVFGRSYGFWGIDTTLHTPVVAEDGRSLTVTWEILGYAITQTAALSKDGAEAQTGSIGLSYSVENRSGSAGAVSIRVLLDTALGNDVDAPYLTPITTAGAGGTITTERVYTGADIPLQIRGVDSQTNPTKASYLVMSEDVNGYVTPDKLAVGHWANLADTPYAFQPDPFCDFSNYSNSHRTPDAALALYWENIPVAPGATATLAEVLYGVGDFDADQMGKNLGISANLLSRPTLDETGKAYENGGAFQVQVTVDNSVTDAKELKDVTLTAVTDEGMTLTSQNNIEYTALAKGGTVDVTFDFTAVEQRQITAQHLSIGITATEVEGENLNPVTYSADVSVLLPSIQSSAPVTITEVAPRTVYTGGTKTITLAGNLESLTALEGSDDWQMYLVHQSGAKTLIEKKTIAFLDEDHTTMTASTESELLVGDYQVEFHIQDATIREDLGAKLIANQTLEVSNDPKYKVRTYGLMALVREGSDYRFAAFDTEQQFAQFEADITRPNEEMLLVVRGAIKEATATDGSIYHTVSHADGDITINEILTYVGDTPMTLVQKGTTCTVAGDGLIKVIDSIDVWSSQWQFQVTNGPTYSIWDEAQHPVTLEMGGVGYMLQAMAGFLIDMKFGELTAEEADAGDDTAYGISFGGSITLPIAVSKSKTTTDPASPGGDPAGDATPSDPADSIRQSDNDPADEDYGEAMQNLFAEEDDGMVNSTDEDAPPAGGDDTPGSGDPTAPTPSTETATLSAMTENPGGDSGSLGVEIEDIRYGQDPDNMDVGFIGIDTTVSIELPEDVLGSFISNAAGVSGSLTINTLDNDYAVEAGLKMQMIACEGRLAFKQTQVGNTEVVVPDNIQFYIRDGLLIPVPPPGPLFLTGMGGGIDNLADTIGGEFTTLPPLTIKLGINMEIAEILGGQLDAEVSLSGIELVGHIGLKLTSNSTTNPGQTKTTGLDINSVVRAQWVDPLEFSVSGTLSVVGGLLSGTVQLVIQEDFFGGYACVVITVPDDIPLIGGYDIAQVEAAVSTECIGAKLTIIGISYGVIYYWDGDYDFGSDVDITLMSAGTATQTLNDETGEQTHVNYGTNITPLTATPVTNQLTPMAVGDVQTLTSYSDQLAGSDMLLLSVPFQGGMKPSHEDVTLTKPDGQQIPIVPDDGKGGGNYLAQFFSDGSGCLYFTVTDPADIQNGNWTITAKTDLGELTLGGVIGFNAVANIPQLLGNQFTYDPANPFALTVDWTAEHPSSTTPGMLDVYLTENPNVLTDILTSTYTDGLGTRVATVKLNEVGTCIAASGSVPLTLPDGMASGDYYVVTTLSAQTGGMSTAISANTLTFVNPKLPKDVQGVDVRYAGDKELFVDITDADDLDYTHYLVELTTASGAGTGIIQQFPVGETIYMGKPTTMTTYTQTDAQGKPLNPSETQLPGIVPGQIYGVRVRTLKETTALRPDGSEKETVYYGAKTVTSATTVTVPTYQPPVLLDVESNIATDTLTNEPTLEIIYTFQEPVWLNWWVNGVEKAGSQFAKEWQISYPLVDGAYAIDFTAMGMNKDTATAADFASNFPQLGFLVDTQPPVLSLMQESHENVSSMETAIATAANSAPDNFVVATNLVRAAADGSYSLTGLTEQDAQLTVNGKLVAVATDGSFTYDGNLGSQSMEPLSVEATDKAGNISTLMAYAINTALADAASLTLYRRVGEILEPIDDHLLTLGAYETAQLVAVNEDDQGNKVELDSASVDWNILYEKNLIAFADGQVTARGILGETAIRVSNPVGTFVDAEGNQVMAYIEDYVIIAMEESDKDALNQLIAQSNTSIASPGGASSSQIAAFQTAIDAALVVSQNPAATEAQIAAAVAALQSAKTTFEAAKNSGGGSGGGGGSSSSYRVTVSSGEKGSLVASHTTVAAGTSVTFTATPDEGYEVAEIFVNDVFYTNGTLLTLPAVGENLQVTAQFAPRWEHTFVDVDTHDWFYDYVRYAYQNGYMKGISETEFAPSENLNRGMMVTVLGRMLAVDVADSTISFADVAADAYYAPYVSWAVDAGITKGTGEGLFQPQREISRQEMTTMIYRMVQYLGGSASPDQDYTMTFVDTGLVSTWAKEGLTYLAEGAVITGKEGDRCDPQGMTTRAELATVIQRLVRLLGQECLDF